MRVASATLCGRSATSSETSRSFSGRIRASIMIAPPENHSRYLGVIGFATTKAKRGTADLSYGVEALLEFFPGLSDSRVKEALGPTQVKATPGDLMRFARNLASLLASTETDQTPGRRSPAAS